MSHDVLSVVGPPTSIIHAAEFKVGDDFRVLLLASSAGDLSEHERSPDFRARGESRCFDYVLHQRAGARTLIIRPKCCVELDAVNQDLLFQTRLDVAQLLTRILVQAPRDVVRVQLPFMIASACLGSTEDSGRHAPDAAIAASGANTHKKVDALVAEFLAGAREYDLRRYVRDGVASTRYSHCEHFSWIYSREILLIEGCLRRMSGQLTVVDLGTDGCQFIAVAGKALTGLGFGGRVRFLGIDRSPDRMQRGRTLLADLPGLRVDLIEDDVCSPGFPDRLRRLEPDVVVANHLLEHLPGNDIQNVYLQDWLFAARRALCLSVPLNDTLETSISDHVREFTEEQVETLGRSMEIRTGYAVEAPDLDTTKAGGLCAWVRKDSGGFGAHRKVLLPRLGARPGNDSLLQDFAKPFNPLEFAVPRRALTVAEISDKGKFSRRGCEPRQIRQLLVKCPGTSVELPSEFDQCEEALQSIIDHNAACNPDYETSYAYLNVFRGMTQFSSYRGLSLSCHGDQLQTIRDGYEYKPDWSYIVSDTLPTILFEQGFDVTEALVRARAGETVNLYRYFNEQADLARRYYSRDYSILLLSPYVVHSASDAVENVHRVFMKVAFSTKRFFDNRELRSNPAFAAEAWLLEDTLGYRDGWLQHAHWNERFLRRDIMDETT